MQDINVICTENSISSFPFFFFFFQASIENEEKEKTYQLEFCERVSYDAEFTSCKKYYSLRG
jgi:hypothetical protein